MRRKATRRTATTKCEGCGKPIPVINPNRILCPKCGWRPGVQPSPTSPIKVTAEKRDLNGAYELQIKGAKLLGYVREHKFLPDRKFRFDFAWPLVKLAVEIDGGNWMRGGHNTGVGHKRDCEKGNLAAIHGWRLLRFITDSVDDGSALTLTERALITQ